MVNLRQGLTLITRPRCLLVPGPASFVAPEKHQSGEKASRIQTLEVERVRPVCMVWNERDNWL